MFKMAENLVEQMKNDGIEIKLDVVNHLLNVYTRAYRTNRCNVFLFTETEEHRYCVYLI